MTRTDTVYCTEGTADKQYTLTINPVKGGFELVAAYGRRGSTMPRLFRVWYNEARAMAKAKRRASMTTGLTIFTRDREGTECTRHLCPTHAAPYFGADGRFIPLGSAADSVVVTTITPENCTKCRHAEDVASGKVVWRYNGWDWSPKELARREAIILRDGEAEGGRGDWWA
jgi:hypothetical protein